MVFLIMITCSLYLALAQFFASLFGAIRLQMNGQRKETGRNTVAKNLAHQPQELCK